MKLPIHLRPALAILAIGLGITAGVYGQDVSPKVAELYRQAQQAQSSGQTSQAVADYQEILRLAPSVAPAYNNLGRLYFNLGRYSEAVTVLSKGLEISPDMHPAQVMLGASYLALNQPHPALQPLQAGVEAMPEDRFARVTLARTLLALNQPAPAIPQLEAALQLKPNDEDAWYLLGKAHLQLSQQAFAEVQSLDANGPLAHLLDGEIMESMQNSPGAIDAYKQAIAAAPADPAPVDHLAGLYLRLGDAAHARESYQKLLVLQPGNCIAHWKLAKSLDSLQEQPEEALREINLALTACPTLAEAHAERAILLLRLKRPADALPDLKIAEQAAPDEASVQHLLAEAYRALGDKEAAAAADRRFVAIEQARRKAEEDHAARVLHNTQP